MDKRYQVFISSTYEDLREERSKVMTALLELDCIPSGMELFPAADDDAWSLIQRVIDECDYYLLILAGRYGSVDDSGMGYTEKEYRYALEKGKPILAFVHASPEQLPAGKCEREPALQEKLKAFRDLASRKLRKPWSNSDELASVVSRSMVQQIKVKPGIGWIRADQIPAHDVLTETIRLQKRVRELESQLSSLNDGHPLGSEALKQGDDLIDLECEYYEEEGSERKLRSRIIQTTWNTVTHILARPLLGSPRENELSDTLATTLLSGHDAEAAEAKDLTGWLTKRSREIIRIQFRALGIATQDYEAPARDRDPDNPRSYIRLPGDHRWYLTPYGDRLVTQMLALRRE